jgi:hypothetical protein
LNPYCRSRHAGISASIARAIASAAAGVTPWDST